MRFYLNNEEVKIEVAPVLTETQDFTLDTLNVVLEANSRANPYEPHTPFTIVFNEVKGESAEFVISADKVSIFSYEPLRYKHELYLEQNTRKLVHHLVRNSNLTRPAKDKKSFYAQCLEPGTEFEYDEKEQEIAIHKLVIKDDVGNLETAAEFTQLSSREKIDRAFVKIDVWASFQEPSQEGQTISKCSIKKIKNLSELKSLLSGREININDLCIVAPNSNGVSYAINDIDITDFENEQESKILRQKTIEYGTSTLAVVPKLVSGGTRDKEPTQFIEMLYITNEINCILLIVNISTRFETYYYNCYDVIDLLLKRQQQRYNGTSKEPLFSLPTNGELYDLLTSTVAPNIALTQSNMFDALTDIFNLFDATFKIENGILDIEYLNDRNKGEITNKNFAGINLQLGEEKRVNGLVTHYQNAKQEIKFPNKGYAPIRSSQLGTPSQSTFDFIVPHSIDIIEKVEMQITKFQIGKQTAGVFEITGDFSIDLTPYVVEENVWSLLNTTDEYPFDNDYRTVIQKNSLYYSKGGNKIIVSYTYEDRFGLKYYALKNAMQSAFLRMFGVNYTISGLYQTLEPDYNDWKNIFMKIRYVTTLNGVTKTESLTSKYKGEALINQNSVSIDINKMGLNMLGVSLKTGEPKLHATHTITSWNDRITKGKILTYENEQWVANTCRYTILDETYIKGEIEFVKNFNALSTRIKLDREKRLYNVSNELSLKSEDIITEYCYFTTDATKRMAELESATVFDITFIANTLNKTYNGGSDELDINIAVLDSPILENPIEVPFVCYGLGTSICFEMSFNDAISAGNQMTTTSGWFGSDKYFSKIVRYTEEDGFLDTANIYFVAYDGANGDYPEIKNVDLNYYVGAILNYQVSKQPNEIFALNYQICFLPMDSNEDFVGNEFIKNNALTQLEKKKHNYFLYYTTGKNDYKYSVMDTKGVSDVEPIAIAQITSSVVDNGERVELEFFFQPAIEEKFNTWAICDENGNIHFSSNKSMLGLKNTVVVNIYFKHDRL